MTDLPELDDEPTQLHQLPARPGDLLYGLPAEPGGRWQVINLTGTAGDPTAGIPLGQLPAVRADLAAALRDVEDRMDAAGMFTRITQPERTTE